MLAHDWLLLDTETTGFAAPIYVVEIAAQRMRGWAPVGKPFRRLLNQNRDIPPEASRVHGYTREILERDCEPPHDVYAAFARYADGLPLVAYNLEYDLDQVLVPEWKRLGIAPPAPAGFCALRLAQRLLDPVPAGNCKLQTLRQYYRLAGSSNERSAGMGRWYLREIERGVSPEASGVATTTGPGPEAAGSASIIIYTHPDLAQFRVLVASARARLANLEAAYTSDKAKVSVLQARLFKRLRPHYEERDRVRLVVSYRRTFLDVLLRQGEEEAERVQDEFHQAEARTKKEYEDTGAAMESKRQLSPDEENEVKSLWKKLVKLFHPDRFADDPEKLDTYNKLTAAINAAKDNGDLETLRGIAEDPVGFVLRQGWTAIEFGDSDELDQLRKLWESLEAEIISVLEATNALKESPDWELHQLVEREPEVFERVVEKQIAGITTEVTELKTQAEKLERVLAVSPVQLIELRIMGRRAPRRRVASGPSHVIHDHSGRGRPGYSLTIHCARDSTNGTVRIANRAF